MEGSETPKGIAESGNKELESKATELANDTRKQGIGILNGNFPRLFLQRLGRKTYANQGFTHAGAFMQGDETRTLIRPHFTMGASKGPYNRQVWRIKSYTPPMETEEITEYQDVQKKEKRLGFITKVSIVKEPVKVRKPTGRFVGNGKYGTGDWIRYDYLMPANDFSDKRVGLFVSMSIAVPPEIARQIDEQVEKNPYFPDAYFKALYPDLTVGEDMQKHLKRIPATELNVIDERQRPTKQLVRKFPTPIPY